MLFRLILLAALFPAIAATRFNFTLDIFCSYMPQYGLNADIIIESEGWFKNSNLLEYWFHFPPLDTPQSNGTSMLIVTPSRMPPLFSSNFFYPRALIKHNCFNEDGRPETGRVSSEYRFQKCKYGPFPCIYEATIKLDDLVQIPI